jgi:pimeloyl-ACP methyl ester carboxylesterase
MASRASVGRASRPEHVGSMAERSDCIPWCESDIACSDPNLSLRVLEWSKEGMPCIMLHGAGDAAVVWDHLSRHIAPRLRPIALDLRGHGDSSWDPGQEYDSRTMMGDVERVIEALNLKRVVLIGHSLGAEIAVRAMSRNRGRVVALVIVDFGPELLQAGVDRVRTDLGEMPSSFASPDAYTAWLMDRRPLSRPELLRQLARYNLRPSADGTCELKVDPAIVGRGKFGKLNRVSGRYCQPELWHVLSQITVPTLVVRGKGSSVVPPDVASRMAEHALPVGRLAVIAGAGHSVMMDRPDEFTDAVIQFLATCLSYYCAA